MGVSAFGGCDSGIKWSYDDEGNICVAGIPNCITGEDLKIPAFPEDKFTKGEVSEDGQTLTLSCLEGVEGDLTICLNPVIGAAVVDANGVSTEVPIVDKVLQFTAPEEPETICWGLDENGCPVLNIKNCITGEDLVIDAVQEVTGNVVDNADPKRPVVTAVASVTGDGVDNTDPQNPVIASSTTVPSADGTQHIVTTDDGVSTPVCLEPVKSVSGDGVDAGDPANPVITQGTVSDQENGLSGIVTDFNGAACEFLKAAAYNPSSTVPAPEGFHTITTADNVTTEVCLTPVKGVTGDGVDNTDPQNPVIASSSTVPSADGTQHIVTTDDGVATPVCLEPVKSVTGPFVDNTDPANPIINVPADQRLVALRIVEGPDGTYNWEADVGPGDGTVTATYNAGPVVDVDTFGTVVPDNGDGTGTVLDAAGNSIVVCLDPVKDILDEDGNSIVTDGVGQLPATQEFVIDCPEGSNKGTMQIDQEPAIPFLKGLNKCSNGDAVALDCDTDQVRTTEDGGVSHVTASLPAACVDLACAPTLPACPKEGDLTFDAEGITWQIQAGAYVPVAFTPKSEVVVMNDDAGGTTGISDAEIALLTGVWTDIDCIEETYVNDTCTRVQIKAVVRGMFQMAGTAGNLWSMRLFQIAGGDFRQGNGAPDSLLDVTNGEPFGQQKDYGEYNAYAKVDPGQSVTLRVCAQGRVVNGNYVSDANNSMDIVGLTGRFEVARCC